MITINADKLSDGLYQIQDGQIHKYKSKGGTVRSYEMGEVVRCKDCKWSDWYTTADGHTFCYCMETGNGGRTENDYCSYGEREDSEA